MNHCKIEELEILKNKIHENVSVNDDVVCSLCDALISAASKKKSWQDVAFGHVWRADYFFYVASDLKSAARELDIAHTYIDEKTPSNLLEKYYTLKHVLFENSYDVQSAFSFTLKALDVAEKLGLGHRIGANYGNIGAYYMDICYYEEAMLYTRKALKTLCSLPDARPRMIRVLLANLIQISLKLNNHHMATIALNDLSQLPLEEKDLKIYIDYGYLLYYASLQDVENTLTHLNSMFKDGLMEFSRAYAFEFLSKSIEAILRLGQKEKSKELLILLKEVVEDDEPDAQLSLCKLELQWAEYFGSAEQLSFCYREYYNRYMAAQIKTNSLKAEGLHTKVALEELSMQNDQSQKEIFELTELVNYDELTKVYNRRYLNIRQDEILNSESTTNLGFAVIDIDYFKEYNDYYGHPAGDKLLTLVASILKKNTTQRMEIFRFGGDEFVCLHWNANTEELEAFVKGVQASMIKESIVHLHSHCSNIITLSIGYGCRPVTGKTDLLALFDEADKALYIAKNEGRNSACSIKNLKGKKEGL